MGTTVTNSCGALVLLLVWIGCASPQAAAQSTERVSIDSSGAQANGGSNYSSTSANGRYIAFTSYASNLVAGDANGARDVFVRDLVSQSTEIVSVSSSGAPGNLDSDDCAISGDGRYVAFASRATDLVVGDTNGAYDVFVHDRVLGITECVSLDGGGELAIGGDSRKPSTSFDGRYVAFQSYATNLVSTDTNAECDVFVRDRLTGTTERMSVGPNGEQGGGPSVQASISADGRLVAFASSAWGFVQGDTNGGEDVFVRDRLLGVIECVSVSSSGALGLATSYSPSISADGRFVAFVSLSSNLAPFDTNGLEDVFVRDRSLGATERVSVSSDGFQSNGYDFHPCISADGRFVAFTGYGDNLVPNDSNVETDVFVRDRLFGRTERVSVDSAGAQANGASAWPSISADGRRLVFYSTATRLVPGDTNGTYDVFLRNRGPELPASFCTAGTTVAGCVPAIRGEGAPSSIATSDFDIVVDNVPTQKMGLIFYGLSSIPQPQPWALGSSSYLCLYYPVNRTGAHSSGGSTGACDGELRVDWNAWRTANPAAIGSPFAAGQVLFAQGWFRDSGAAKGTNLSDGLIFTLWD